MKHVFIINPIAGPSDISGKLTKILEDSYSYLDYEIYITQSVNDAHNYVSKYLENTKEEVTFYSCGGDGTLNEVISGAYGFDNARVACYPCGSGNDYIKYYGKCEDFLDLDSLINGTSHKVDLIKVNDHYSINICNLGFDALACLNMIKFKNKKFVGKNAYTFGVLYSLLFGMKHICKIEVDGKLVKDGNVLLASIANGICYGNGYYCAPDSINDDGLLDICIVKKICRIRFMSIIKKYKNGKYLHDPKYKKIVTYLRGKNVKIIGAKPIAYCVDGEVFTEQKIDISIIEAGINFVIPKKILDLRK